MSNINISFQQTLRAKYSVHESARFTPLPSLDLGLLTEILVRERRVVALNAGCSVLPGKPAPRFIQDLQDRGYHVDLRERAGVSSSDEMSARAGPVRYVEDLVDETLQTRIAESVMEYFQAQGTLVIATGDAQPAKYSDGFFTYAERALKMGWNVEVVSWRRSLSSCWKGSEWTTRWGNRFRIIELDEFVDDLLACQL
ncbi:cell wall glucanase (Scw4) [Hirsutella rhossiliensis]|uniref:Cell wall glucanase (Scw4) n=1 Tax=Hirsutella rhossiliensis TaxID=111463 RepID=A0A9P8MTV0_9HYPO|nr:cell wall glucanase (Scw4) [Hirsutella rhossiliensis]KAH0960101.1 cell wall glucanase (Scw4) [Hirsutella rhossiliensis]